MHVSFDMGGRPIVFSVAGTGFSGDYVLATILEKTPTAEDGMSRVSYQLLVYINQF